MTDRQWNIVLLASLVAGLLGLCALKGWNPLEAFRTPAKKSASAPPKATPKPLPSPPHAIPAIAEMVPRGPQSPLADVAYNLAPADATPEELTAVSTVFGWVSWRAGKGRYATADALLAHTRESMQAVIEGKVPPYQDDPDWRQEHPADSAPLNGDVGPRYARWKAFSQGIAERLAEDNKQRSSGLTTGDLSGLWAAIASGLDKAREKGRHGDG